MAYKQKGMSFGEGTGYRAPQSSNLKAKWSTGTNEAGYITKTKSGRNLFGRKRNVTKYYDPVTGKKVGKKVDVARGKGDPRPNKVKLKKVNPGLTQSGGVGKIRLSENPWEKPTGKTDPKPTDPKPTDPKPNETSNEETNLNRAQRAAQINLEEGGTFNVDFDPNNPRIETYKKSFAGFKVKDGKRWNPKKKKWYDDSPEGLKEYEDDSEEWWREQAKLTENEKLKKQNQEYGVDEEGNVKYSK